MINQTFLDNLETNKNKSTIRYPQYNIKDYSQVKPKIVETSKPHALYQSVTIDNKKNLCALKRILKNYS